MVCEPHPGPSTPPHPTRSAGKFYTLLTGANEKRWGRMKDKISTVVKSFTVDDRY